MEKDSGNPFAEFGSAKQSSSSKSNEESSEGSEKKKSKSIFKWSKKDKDAKKDKVTVAKVEGDADDSQSQTLSEEVVKTRTGNRSMSEASSVVAANARARLLQDPLNKERSNSATRSSIVISPRQASIGPRLATWNQTPSSQSEEGIMILGCFPFLLFNDILPSRKSKVDCYLQYQYESQSIRISG